MLCVVSLPSVAASRELADELYEAAQLKRNYPGWYNSMYGMVLSYQPALPREIFDKLSLRFNRLGNEKRYKRRTVKAIRELLDDTGVRVILKWFSEDGGLITLQERELSAEDFPDKPLNLWLQEEKLSSVRARYLHALIDDTGAIDQSADIIVQSALSMAVLVSGSLPEGQERPDINIVKQKLAVQRPAIKEELKKVSLARFAWIYQDVSDEQLSRYVTFAKNPDAQAWFKAINQAQGAMLMSGKHQAL